MVKKILNNKLMDDTDVLDQIVQLTHGMFDFWKNAYGWAPIKAADFLSSAMLEWQKSLSTSLRKWVSSTSDGDLILAWANLGALTEGAMKLFLSAYLMITKMTTQRRSTKMPA